MRKILTAAFTLAILSICPVQAQSIEDAASLDRFVEMARQDIQKMRIELMENAMEFSAEQAAAFWPLYRDYLAKYARIGDEMISLIDDYEEHFESMSDHKAGELARRALGVEEERTALKKEYFRKIETALSSVIAARFLQAENQINLLLDLRIASNLPLIQGPER